MMCYDVGLFMLYILELTKDILEYQIFSQISYEHW